MLFLMDMSLEEEYFNRWNVVRHVIATRSDLLEVLRATFDHEYHLDSLPSQVLYIGGGSCHHVYSVGTIQIPQLSKPLDIALRVRQRDALPYEDWDLSLELHNFVEAFEMRKNPPYFIGAVKSHTLSDGLPAWGMLTQDLTARKTLRLKEEAPSCFAFRPCRDGSYERFFIDPPTSLQSDYGPLGKRYVEGDACIVL